VKNTKPAEYDFFSVSEDCENLGKIFEMHPSCDLETLVVKIKLTSLCVIHFFVMDLFPSHLLLTDKYFVIVFINNIDKKVMVFVL